MGHQGGGNMGWWCFFTSFWTGRWETIERSHGLYIFKDPPPVMCTSFIKVLPSKHPITSQNTASYWGVTLDPVWRTLHIWTTTGETVMDIWLLLCYDQFLNGGKFLTWECYVVGILLHKTSVSEAGDVLLCLLLDCDEEQSHTRGSFGSGGG